jgi:hypothetical protein
MAVAAALLWAGAGLAKPVLPVLDGVLPFVGVHHVIPPEAALAYPPTLQRPYATVLTDRIGARRQWRYQPDLYGPLFEVQFEPAAFTLSTGRGQGPLAGVLPFALLRLATAGLPLVSAPVTARSGVSPLVEGGGSAPAGEIPVAPVPLPASCGLALALVTLAGLAARRRIRAPSAGSSR